MRKVSDGTSEVKGGARLLIRALRHRNYRLFFGGQSISLIGTWMQRIAMSWLVYRLTGSAFLLGVVGFAGHISVLVATPFGGAMADRRNRHRILLATQSLAMIQAFILSALVLTGAVRVWQIACLSFFLGLVDSFDMPARQSFLVEMVEKREDLGNAIALNSFMVNGARLLGPSIAGLLIAHAGEGMCFLINGLTYLAVIFSLLAMRVKPRILESKRREIFRDVKEGFSYAAGYLPIRMMLLLVTLVSLMGMSHNVLMPVFARDVLRGDSHTLGFLMGASGLGALFGVGYLASRTTLDGLERWSVLAAGVFGAGLVLFSLSRSFGLSLLLMFLSGFGMMVQHTSSSTVLQLTVEEDKRGRVMSLYTLAFRGMMPFGSLLAGTLASRIGAPSTLLINGSCCVIGALLFSMKLSYISRAVRLASGNRNSYGEAGAFEPGNGITR